MRYDAHLMPEENSERPGWWAHLLAWTLGAAVNAVFIIIVALRLGEGDAGLWLIYLIYDLGHFLVLGVISATLFAAWSRWGPPQPGAIVLAQTVGAVAIGSVLLPDNLRHFALGFPGPPRLVLGTLVVGVSCMIPVAGLLGRNLLRSWPAWIGVGLALAIFTVNNLILKKNYEGGHFFFAWAAATVMATSSMGRPSVAWPIRSERARRIVASVCAVLAACTLFARPSQRVLVLLGSLDGSVLFHLIGKHWTTVPDASSLCDVTVPNELAQWFEDRSAHQPIPPSEPPLVEGELITILITIDAVRGELFVEEKYREVAPRLWALADQGVRFTRAYSPGASTLVTISSIFAGKHRSQLDARRGKDIAWDLTSDETVRFTQVLQEAGVPTAQSISWRDLRQQYGTTIGFDKEDFVPPPEGQRFALAERTLAPLMSRIETHGRGPLFLYAHLMDPHSPYDSVPDVEGDDWERHLAELSVCDQQIGALWHLIRARGLSDRTVLIVTSDHGEGFGLHGTPEHGHTVYEELVHVPLLVVGAGVRPRVVDTRVSSLDLGPTILDLFQLETPGHFMGQSLLGFLRGQTPTLTRPVAGTARSTGKAHVLYFFADNGLKVIWDLKMGTQELYDLEKDPGELDNIVEEDGREGKNHMRLLQRFFVLHDYFSESIQHTRGK